MKATEPEVCDATGDAQRFHCTAQKNKLVQPA